MPKLSTGEAVERLIEGITEAKPTTLAEIHAELFPEKSPAPPPTAGEIVGLVRGGLEAEEIVDLWNVVFPEDRNVWYDEEDQKIHFNEEFVGYAEAE